MRNPVLFFSIIIVVIFLLDLYVFKGLRLLAGTWTARSRSILFTIHWAVPIILVLGLIAMMIFQPTWREPKYYTSYMYVSGFFFLMYVPKLVFLSVGLVDDVIKGITWIAAKLAPATSTFATDIAPRISRSKFLTQVGIVLAAIPFFSILYGILRGRFDYKVKKVTLTFKNLPKAFDGFRLLQISDMHIGSFGNYRDEFAKGIDLINEQNADLVVFTGDLVNTFANEVDGWEPELSRIKGKMGQYSILGNHDYGDYYNWTSQTDKQQNFETLVQKHKEVGFNLLRNQNVMIEKDGEKIALIGVENWGVPPFPQYGDFKKAHFGAENEPFKILLSHDPSHWDAEIAQKTNIDLTLSGHTHGMQFGVNLGNIKWSPVKMKYPRWQGLYTEGLQHLYVNVGYGFIGFPGRVGFMPEITVFELKCA